MDTEAIKALRKYVGDRTQEEAAQGLGMSQGMLSKLLNGMVPSFATAIRLEKQAGIPAEDWGGELGEYLKRRRRKAG